MFNLFKKNESRRSAELTDRLARENWMYMDYCQDLIDSGLHTLIGGATGSGKSYLVRELLHYILTRPLGTIDLVLIDPKRVDLVDYKQTAPCKGYAQTPSEALATLQAVSRIMEDRYRIMSRDHLKKWTGNRIIVVIDEIADLFMSDKGKAIKAELQHLVQLGRASNITVICCTQTPHRKVIPAEIQLNFGIVIALRCRSSIESRLLINQAGAETLPLYGYGIIKTPSETYTQTLGVSSEEAVQNRIRIAELIA